SPVLAFVWAGLATLLWVLALMWLNLRLSFLGAAIAVEGLSVRAGLKRSWTLTGRGFWRLLGQLALGYFLSNQLVQLVISPLAIVISVALGLGLATTEDSAAAQAAIGLVSAALLLALSLISSAVLFAYFSCLVTCASSSRRCAPKASTSCSSAPRRSDDPGSPLPRLGAVDRTGHRPGHRPRMGRERTVETGVLGSRSHTLGTDRPLDLLPLGLAGQCGPALELTVAAPARRTRPGRDHRPRRLARPPR